MYGVKVLWYAPSPTQADPFLVLQGNSLVWILSSTGLGVNSPVVVEDWEFFCCARAGRARFIITCFGRFVPLAPVPSSLDSPPVLVLHSACRTIWRFRLVPCLLWAFV